MSRPWVKLMTSIYRHPELGLVSDSAWRRFVECIALAGDIDEGGRLGSDEAVARQLYTTVDQLRNDVEELGGRISEHNGHLFVRDWLEHQPAKRTPEPAAQVTERTRSLRAKGTQRNGNAEGTQRERRGNGSLEVEVEVEKRVEIDTEVEVLQRARAREGVLGAPPPETSPAKSRRPATLPPHVTHPEVWEAVCAWLGLDVDPRQLSKVTAANLRRLAVLYVKAEEEPERVRADAEAWWSGDWRGKQGQAPSVAQAQDWRSRCRRNGHALPGRGTESPEWRKDKPADPRWVRAITVARIAGDSASLIAMSDPKTREEAVNRVLAAAADEEVSNEAT